MIFNHPVTTRPYALTQALDEFTIMFALKFPALPSEAQDLILYGDTPALDGYRFRLNTNGSIEWGQADGESSPGTSSTMTTTLTASANAWFHVAARYNGTARQGRIWLNGIIDPGVLDADPPAFDGANGTEGPIIGDNQGTTVAFFVDDWALCRGAFDANTIRRAASCGLNGAGCLCDAAQSGLYASTRHHANDGGVIVGSLPPCDTITPTFVHGIPPPYAYDFTSQLTAGGGGAWWFEAGEDGTVDSDVPVTDRSGRGNGLDCQDNCIMSGSGSYQGLSGYLANSGAAECLTQNGNVCSHPEDFHTGVAEYTGGGAIQLTSTQNGDVDLIYTNTDIATNGGFRLRRMDSNPDKFRIEHRTASGVIGCTGTTTVSQTSGQHSVIFRFDAGTLELFVDGKQDCSVASGVMNDYTGTFRINHPTVSWVYDDIFFATNRAWSDATIARIAACNTDGRWCTCNPGNLATYGYATRTTAAFVPTVTATLLACNAPAALVNPAATTTTTSTSSSTSTSTSSTTTTSTSSTTTTTV